MGDIKWKEEYQVAVGATSASEESPQMQTILSEASAAKIQAQDEQRTTNDERLATNDQMRPYLQLIGWLACVVYSTIPTFWLMIHPFADRWRARSRSPYIFLLPAWIAIWIVVALITGPWRDMHLYRTDRSWAVAAPLFIAGIYIYRQSGKNFTAKQLGGLPELHGRNDEQRLVIEGIRNRVRHPMYLAHLCEMLAWSVGTGLTVSWGLTAFAVFTGAVMIREEEEELQKRFGEQYREYRKSVPAIVPRLGKAASYNPH